ncbi:MAG: hypothetical protein ABSB70_22240 [Candidatus Velthaea sp.]
MIQINTKKPPDDYTLGQFPVVSSSSTEAPLDSRTVLDIFLIVALCAIILLVWLAKYRQSALLAQSAVTARGYGIRRHWFWFTLIVAFAIYAITIPAFPYRKAQASVNAQHYSVIAQHRGFLVPAVVPLDTSGRFRRHSKRRQSRLGMTLTGRRTTIAATPQLPASALTTPLC